MAGPRRRGSMSAHARDAVGVTLAVIGIYLVGLSIFMLIAPGTFFDEIAPIGVRNDHYIRDGATFQLALGILALIAASRRDVRLVAVVVIGVQFSLHALNHLVDIDEAHLRWLGTANLIGLASGALVAGWLFRQVRGGTR